MDKHAYRDDLVCSVCNREIYNIIRTGESKILYNSDGSLFTEFSEQMAIETRRKYGNNLVWIGEKKSKLKSPPIIINEGMRDLKSFKGIFKSAKKEPSYKDFI